MFNDHHSFNVTISVKHADRASALEVLLNHLGEWFNESRNLPYEAGTLLHFQVMTPSEPEHDSLDRASEEFVDHMRYISNVAQYETYDREES